MPDVRTRLLDWYRAHRRDLPWRRTRDPYQIWISEVMLQQTRVDTVLPYFEEFVRRWPTVSKLDAEDPEAVRAAWSGLGYYRRARLMLEAAATIVRDHDGRVPRDPDELRALPGFGRYTTGAVASIAFDHPLAAVDGNVQRVLARLEGIEGDVSRGAANKQVWSAAEALVEGTAPGELNQALIELGATLCRTRNPSCERCPVAAGCVAREQGRQHELPPPRKRAEKKRVELTAIVARRGRHEIVMEQRPDDGILAGLWSPPLIEGLLPADAAVDEAERRWGWTLDEADDAGRVKHVLTHREIHMSLVSARTDDAPAGMRAVDVRQLDQFGVPSVTTRALRAALPPELLEIASLRGRRTRI